MGVPHAFRSARLQARVASCSEIQPDWNRRQLQQGNTGAWPCWPLRGIKLHCFKHMDFPIAPSHQLFSAPTHASSSSSSDFMRKRSSSAAFPECLQCSHRSTRQLMPIRTAPQAKRDDLGYAMKMCARFVVPCTHKGILQLPSRSTRPWRTCHNLRALWIGEGPGAAHWMRVTSMAATPAPTRKSWTTTPSHYGAWTCWRCARGRRNLRRVSRGAGVRCACLQQQRRPTGNPDSRRHRPAAATRRCCGVAHHPGMASNPLLRTQMIASGRYWVEHNFSAPCIAGSLLNCWRNKNHRNLV